MKKFVCFLLCMSMLLWCAACGAADASTNAASESGSEAVSAAAEPDAAAAVSEAEPASASDAAVEEASAKETSTAEEPTVTVEMPLFDETTSYTIWLANSPDLSELIDDFSDFLVISEMEKLTNLHWDATMVSFAAKDETFQLMVASQDYTDVVSGGSSSYATGGDAAIEDEFLIDLSGYIDSYMPNLTKWMNDYPEIRRSMVTTDGNICAFPKINDPGNEMAGCGMLRNDWLNDLGLDMPVTFDDLYNVLVAFRDEKGAETPMQIAEPTGLQNELVGGYNISGEYYQVDDEVRFGPIQPEFEDYLKMMNQWYSEGLIDPNFINNSMNIMTDYSNVYNGKTGVWYTSNISSITSIDSNAVDPNFDAMCFCNVTVDGGKCHTATMQSVFGGDSWSVTTACEDPAPICEYVDYLYSDDGILLCNFGVEGYTFEYNEDGDPRLTDVVLNNPDYSYNIALNIYTCDMQTQVPFIVDNEKETSNYTDAQWESYYISGSNADGEYMYPTNGASLTADEAEEYNASYSDIDTYIEENVSKFITGAEDFSAYDDFVQTIYDMGIERCIELKQEAYNRYLAK